jgi:predicted enzyme related to lactoylglutathione lyase|nr:VOC family protein [Kofleriaceae bacterium]
MAKITGIGGVFVKAAAPDQLRAFYRDILGITLDSWGGAQLWNDGPRNYGVWSVFDADTTYFAPSAKPFMLNLRVDDLDGLLAAIRARGGASAIVDRREDTPDGKFGYVVDPEGTLIELFQPASLL